MVRAVALALALIACGHSQKPRDFLGERVPTQCAHDEETEECTGWWMDQLMVLLGQRSYDDPAVARYVTAVGNRLARAAGDRRPWKFRVLDDASVQAFVIMGSVVYIHRGTLAILRSEAELAAVLAHEMGHLRGGHSKEKWDDISRSAMGRSELEKSMQHAYDRDDEIQADETAVLLLGRAGYDPHAVEAMLRAIAGTTTREDPHPDDVHPWWPERIARAQAITAGRGELGEERYRNGVASLIVGADPRRIQLQGHAIVFASASAALDLPAFENPVLDEDSLTITLSDGGKARLFTVNADFAKLLAAQAEDAKRVLEIHHERGREAIAISVTGTPNAASMARAMRGAMREPRPAELARLSPTRVDLRAPRRIWQR